jgi:hypothetical protein
MGKIVLASVMTFALLSCFFIALACAENYTVTQNPPGEISVGDPVTITGTISNPPMSGVPVVFRWYNPALGLKWTDGPINTDANGQASSTRSPDAVGKWTVVVVFATGEPEQIFAVTVVYRFNAIPELPLIGTVGASIAMLAGLAYKMKRKRP